MKNWIKDLSTLISAISFMAFAFHIFSAFLVVGNDNAIANRLTDRAIYSLIPFFIFGVIAVWMDRTNNEC